jgi:hypothetical protein
MAENLIKEKTPEYYNFLSKLSKNLNWDHIKEDLEDLYWVIQDDFTETGLISSIWKISDRWAVSELTLSPRYPILKQTKLKFTLNSYINKITDRNKIKEICRIFMDTSQTLLFLDKAYNSLNDCSQDTFASFSMRLFDVYSDLKKTLTSIFMHIEKHLKIEHSKNLSEMLDQAFYEKVVFHHKTRFNQDPSTKKIVLNLEKSQKNKATCDDTTTSNTNFSYKGVNKYIGELDINNQRQGYGKITYHGGDTYEGYWKLNKKHGEGLYKYKYGGYYYGNFVDDLPSGQGCKVYSSGNKYTGQFNSGKKQGNGEMCFKNGDLYEGEWDNDNMQGQGKYTWVTGDYFVGSFARDQRDGKGELHLITGQVVEGIWKNGLLLN